MKQAKIKRREHESRRIVITSAIVVFILCVVYALVMNELIANRIYFYNGQGNFVREYLRQYLEYSEKISDEIPLELSFFQSDADRERSLYITIQDAAGGLIQYNQLGIPMTMDRSNTATWIADRESREKILRTDFTVFMQGTSTIYTDIRATFSDALYEEITEFEESINDRPPHYATAYMTKYILRDDIAYPLELTVEEDDVVLATYNADLDFAYSPEEVQESPVYFQAGPLIKPLHPDYADAKSRAEESYNRFVETGRIPTEDRWMSRGKMSLSFVVATEQHVAFSQMTIDYTEMLNREILLGCILIILISAIIAAILCGRARRKRAKAEYERSVTNALAHNYKSSLMIIRSCAENLLTGVSEEKKVQYEQKIMDEADHMSESTEKLLSFYRTGAAGYQPVTEKIDASALCRELVRKYEQVSAERDLKWAIEDTEKFVVEGDPILFSMALDNLIGNATKYALSGSEIRIETAKDHLTLENRWMPVEKFIKKPKLFFEAFVTGDDQPGRSNSGIGLSVTRDLLQRMGLHIEAQATQEKVTFEIR